MLRAVGFSDKLFSKFKRVLIVIAVLELKGGIVIA
jgi:hypothetical protein